MNRQSNEEGTELKAAHSNSESEASVHRIVQITERIDELGKVIQLGRRWRLFIPVLAGMALGAKVLFDLDWVFLVKVALGFGFVLGYVEFVLWRYSKRIEAWEREIEGVGRLPRDSGTPDTLGALDS